MSVVFPGPIINAPARINSGTTGRRGRGAPFAGRKNPVETSPQLVPDGGTFDLAA